MKSRMKRFRTESGAITTDFERDWLPTIATTKSEIHSPQFSAPRSRSTNLVLAD
jgi:hypothetical protein